MSNATPFCNVSIASPPGDPKKPLGLQPIPQNSDLRTAIKIINNNFVNLVKGNYHEQRQLRQTTITRIFDPQGSGAFVDVKQITSISWINPLTGQLISWQQ